MAYKGKKRKGKREKNEQNREVKVMESDMGISCVMVFFGDVVSCFVGPSCVHEEIDNSRCLGGINLCMTLRGVN